MLVQAISTQGFVITSGITFSATSHLDPPQDTFLPFLFSPAFRPEMRAGFGASLSQWRKPRPVGLSIRLESESTPTVQSVGLTTVYDPIKKALEWIERMRFSSSEDVIRIRHEALKLLDQMSSKQLHFFAIALEKRLENSPLGMRFAIADILSEINPRLDSEDRKIFLQVLENKFSHPDPEIRYIAVMLSDFVIIKLDQSERFPHLLKLVDMLEDQNDVAETAMTSISNVNPTMDVQDQAELVLEIAKIKNRISRLTLNVLLEHLGKEAATDLILTVVEDLNADEEGNREAAEDALKTWISQMEPEYCYDIVIELESQIESEDPIRTEALLAGLQLFFAAIDQRDRFVFIRSIEDEKLKNEKKFLAHASAIAIGILTPLLEPKERFPRAKALIERMEDDELLLNGIAEALLRIAISLNSDERFQLALDLITVIAVSTSKNICKTATTVLGYIQIL